MLDSVKKRLIAGEFLNLSEDEKKQLKVILKYKDSLLEVIKSALLSAKTLSLHKELIKLTACVAKSWVNPVYTKIIANLEDRIRNDVVTENILEIYYLHTNVARPQEGIVVRISEKVSIIQKYLVQNKDFKLLPHDIIRKSINDEFKDLILYFITTGYNINAKDRDGNTLLHCAIFAKYREIAKALIKTGRLTQRTVNDKYKYGCTLLYWAIFHRDVETVKALLEYPGIDVNTKGEYGTTPFIFAVASGSIEIIYVLQKHHCYTWMRSLLVNTLSTVELATYELYTACCNLFSNQNLSTSISDVGIQFFQLYNNSEHSRRCDL